MPSISVPTAALALSAVGTGIGAIGAIQQGNAQSAMANYQSQVSANNAKIAAQYAENATQTGEAQAFQEGLKQRQQQEAITAGIAAGGVDVNTGSAADVRTSARELGMLDVEQVRQRAALQAYGYRTQQTSFQAQSQLQTAEAGFDTEAGWLKGIGGLISGAANLGIYSGLGTNPAESGAFLTPGTDTPLAGAQPIQANLTF